MPGERWSSWFTCRHSSAACAAISAASLFEPEAPTFTWREFHLRPKRSTRKLERSSERCDYRCTDTELSTMDRFALAFNGLFSLFGSINIAVPYMLDSLRIPADMFQLFLVTGIVVGRFGAMLAALHIIVLSVIGTLALCGHVQLRPARLLRYVVISSVALLLLMLALRTYFALFVPEPPPREQVLTDIQLMQKRVPASVSSTLIESIPR